MKRKYYKNIDILRVVACVAVLFYHLGILKGGYLAVCTFFVLSGFLSFVSAYSRKKFYVKKYYLSRLKKIYLPLLVVAFLSLFVINFIPGTNWLNMKNETTAVIFCYDNYWQIGVNLDYFSRNANSPFIHFWYVSILLQFDLLFPLIYFGVRKLERKFNKVVPCIITSILSLVSFLFFYKLNTSGNFNASYYDTFARCFSLFIGLNLGMVYSYYKDRLFSKDKDSYLIKRMYMAFLIVLVFLFIAIDSTFYYFPVIMLIVSLLTCVLIIYAVQDGEKSSSKFRKIIKEFSLISYEVYLVQYPIIYVLGFLNLNRVLTVIVALFLTVFSAYIIHSVLNIRIFEKKWVKNIKLTGRAAVILISFFGFIVYVQADDYKREMLILEEELAKREEIINGIQENYQQDRQNEVNKQVSTIEDYDEMIKNIDEKVSALPIIGVGDSVMLGAVDTLNLEFKNGYFDAQISRSILSIEGIINDLNSKGMINGPVVINIGANGDCSESCKTRIIQAVQGKPVFWLTVTNDKDVHINDKLKNLASSYDNLHIIDWEAISSGHKKYFYKDGIHLTPSGRKAYTNAIRDAVKTVYLDEILSKKEKAQKEFEDINKSRITFYGNDLLLYALDKLEFSFNGSVFNVDKSFDYTSLSNKISSLVEDDALSNKVVLAFDSNTGLKKKDYANLFELCGEREIYVVAMDSKTKYSLEGIEKNNIHVIDFYSEIIKHDEYIYKDNIHLTDTGNEALIKMLGSALIP